MNWLFKTEPNVFSIDHLIACKNQTEPWDGIRNYQARNFMRDEMCVGDRIFIYHSNASEIGIVGTAKVASKAYPDPTQFDNKSKYFDPKSKIDNPRWMLVDVKFEKKYSRIITLAELKKHDILQSMRLLQKGNRLSVMPVLDNEFAYIDGLLK